MKLSVNIAGWHHNIINSDEGFLNNSIFDDVATFNG
jgi:hypothetical protein